MKAHLRMDGVKVFPEDAKALDLIMEKEGTKNKSEAYRIALKTYLDLHQLPKEVSGLRSDVQNLNESIQQLYFKMDVQGGGR